MNRVCVCFSFLTSISASSLYFPDYNEWPHIAWSLSGYGIKTVQSSGHCIIQQPVPASISWRLPSTPVTQKGVGDVCVPCHPHANCWGQVEYFHPAYSPFLFSFKLLLVIKAEANWNWQLRGLQAIGKVLEIMWTTLWKLKKKKKSNLASIKTTSCHCNRQGKRLESCWQWPSRVQGFCWLVLNSHGKGRGRVLPFRWASEAQGGVGGNW